jgi:hypothetical protein
MYGSHPRLLLTSRFNVNCAFTFYEIRSVYGIGLLLVAGFVYAKLASCGAVTPASIHEVFQMRHAVAVCYSPFLLVFWSA